MIANNSYMLWNGITLFFSLLFFVPVYSAQASDQIPFNVTEFVIEGINPLSEKITHSTLANFVGKHTDFQGLKAAARALQRTLHRRGYITYRVLVPANQTLVNGVGSVTLQVVGYRVGEITVRGNNHFSSLNILKNVPALQEGITPNSRTLSRQLVLTNEHPSKNLTLRFTGSENPETLNVHLDVEDHNPLNIHASFNNQGTDQTSNSRVSVSMQHSNLFDLDHILTGSYTTSPENLSRVKQYGLNYYVPIYSLGASLNGYYVESDVDSGRVTESFEVSGTGKFSGLIYRQFFNRLGRYSHSAYMGLKDNLFENNVSFNNTPIGADVRSRPVLLGYDGKYQFAKSTVKFHGEYRQNINSGSNNNDEQYAKNRASSDSRWDALRYGLKVDYSLTSNWIIRTSVEAQFANEPLIAGEQLGAGGAHSVRGYDERYSAGDSGVIVNLETWTPPLWGQLRILGFADLGYTAIENAIVGESEDEDLISVGAGIRWSWKQKLSLNFDLGVALRDVIDVEAGDTKAHIELMFHF